MPAEDCGKNIHEIKHIHTQMCTHNYSRREENGLSLKQTKQQVTENDSLLPHARCLAGKRCQKYNLSKPQSFLASGSFLADNESALCIR